MVCWKKRCAWYEQVGRLLLLLQTAAEFSVSEACSPWVLHQAMTNVANRVNENGCNLMGARPPCESGSGDDVKDGKDYLWLGDMKSYADCVKAADEDDVKEGGFPSCKTITYYGDQSAGGMKSQCYCGTTSEFDLTPQPGATAGRYLIRSCWGWPFLGFMIAGVGIYLGAGISYQVTRKKATGLDMLPNKKFWFETAGLLADGFSFCGQHLGLSAGSARSSYSAIDEVQNNGEKAKSSGHVAPARPDSATSKRENKKKSTKEKKSKGKSSNAKSASSSKATTKASRHSSRKETGPPRDAVATDAWSGATAQLAEERDDTGLHSSQAKVKVVLSGSS